MEGSQTRPIIIKKKHKKHAEHHGGSWKVAYADFVTAMMAFFLLMWLLSMASPKSGPPYPTTSRTLTSSTSGRPLPGVPS